ncbi:MAG: antitoxin VapB family protein [Euryarchaeota archaeon]|jgi:predicted CopG family antitoxin|nr:antitoxin VapB family protein [Euryarchaeota archaeon]
MGTKTVGLREEVYERLATEKREGESFSDVVDRVLDDSQTDWRYSFGRMSENAEAFERAVRSQREDMNEGISNRQDEIIEQMRSTQENDSQSGQE